MDRILDGVKRIPVVIAGKECFIEPMTTRHVIEMQEYILKKKAKKIRILFEHDKQLMNEQLKVLFNEEISMDKIFGSDFETMTYLVYIRCSIRNEITYEESLGDLEELYQNVGMLFGDDEKKVPEGAGK
jgi:hypothetical protein